MCTTLLACLLGPKSGEAGSCVARPDLPAKLKGAAAEKFAICNYGKGFPSWPWASITCRVSSSYFWQHVLRPAAFPTPQLQSHRAYRIRKYSSTRKHRQESILSHSYTRSASELHVKLRNRVLRVKKKQALKELTSQSKVSQSLRKNFGGILAVSG